MNDSRTDDSLQSASTFSDNTSSIRLLTSDLLREDTTVEDITASLSSIQRRVSDRTPNTDPSNEWNGKKDELESELLLCAEIGQALLNRHEAYVQKAEQEMEALKIRRVDGENLLAKANAKIESLQQTNQNILSKLAKSTRENAQLERRLLQSLTSLTLSDSSIATLRAELSSVRGSLSKQAGAQARSTGWEDKVRDAQKERDDTREELLGERKLRSESDRRLRKAEDRIADLESKIKAAKRAVDYANQSREDATKNIVEDAASRIQMIRSELDASGSTNPEVQAVLDGLMAENIHLKRDNAELQELLSDYRGSYTLSPQAPSFSPHDSTNYFDNRHDIDAGNISRSSTAFFSDELAASTNSRPVLDRVFSDGVQHVRKSSWAPSLKSINTKVPLPWDGNRRQHGRNDSWTPSIAPSFVSSSSFGGTGGGSATLVSPLSTEGREGDGRESSFGSFQGNSGLRSGVYALKSSNGSAGRRVRGGGSGSGSGTWVRGHVKRSFSLDGPRNIHRVFSGVDSIAERPMTDDEQNGTDPERDQGFFPASPSRRASVPNSSQSTHYDDIDIYIDGSASSISKRTRDVLGVDDLGFATASPEKVKVRQRPMMLLSRSKAVQTDMVDMGTSTGPSNLEPVTPTCRRHVSHVSISPSVSTNNSLDPSISFSPNPQDSAVSSPTLPVYTSQTASSDTASIHDYRTTALVSLIDHMSRLLTKVSQADVQTLTKRLKRQHLPGDVGHLSKSTINAILTEVNELRNHFRAVLDLERRSEKVPRGNDDPESLVTRKDFLLLVKLFKDIFAELSMLRGTVNDVILDPSSAIKLREIVLFDEEEDARGRLKTKLSRQTSGLGWIANPIQKFFITPPVDASEDESSMNTSLSNARTGPAGPDRNKLYPSKAAPKLAAATASTTTTVNVEFGSTGVVRRATSTTTAPQLPSTPHGTISRASQSNLEALHAPSVISSHSSLSIPGEGRAVRTPSPTRISANREHLRGIFAGAAPAVPQGGWSTTSGGIGSAAPSSRLGPKLRSASSQVFRPTTTQRSPNSFGGRQMDSNSSASFAPGSANGAYAQPISAVLDAVLDPSFDTPIIEKTLRPTRSDESIRSTFIGRASPPDTTSAGHNRKIDSNFNSNQQSMISSSFYRPSGAGMFAGLTKRIQAFTEATASSVAASPPPMRDVSDGTSDEI
ncbi:hypothetical protein [Phaffia rhodozyma]|uniref:Uncharacterized protein n=1 Tax=Phaffia rhodozyma TaxID=264483 RepID=A0A0F7SJI2_PHARH|nr:hypothetical protein [Phaffia rhodozyma]